MHGMMQVGSKARYLEDISDFVFSIEFEPSLIIEPFAGLAKYSIDSIYKKPVPFICSDINPMYMMAFNYLSEIFEKWCDKTILDFDTVEDYYHYVLDKVFYLGDDGMPVGFRTIAEEVGDNKFLCLLHELSEPIFGSELTYKTVSAIFTIINKKAIENNYAVEDGKTKYNIVDMYHDYLQLSRAVLQKIRPTFFKEYKRTLYMKNNKIHQLVKNISRFQEHKNTYPFEDVREFFLGYVRVVKDPYLAALCFSRLGFGGLIRTNLNNEYNTPFRYPNRDKENVIRYFPIVSTKFFVPKFLQDCITLSQFGSFHVCDYEVLLNNLANFVKNNRQGYLLENEQACIFIDPPYLKEMTRAEATEQEFGSYGTLAINRSGKWSVDRYAEMATQAESAALSLIEQGIANRVLIIICHSRHTYLINRLSKMGYACHFYERSRRQEFRVANMSKDSESYENLFYKIVE